jgi:hypothetical protein
MPNFSKKFLPYAPLLPLCLIIACLSTSPPVLPKFPTFP